MNSLGSRDRELIIGNGKECKELHNDRNVKRGEKKVWHDDRLTGKGGGGEGRKKWRKRSSNHIEDKKERIMHKSGL